MTDMLELLHSAGVATKKEAATDGGEWAGPCPSCGGEDRFRTWPEKGRFWCRSCGANGDTIDLLRMIRPGLSYLDACRELGKDPGPLSGTSTRDRRPAWVPTAAADPVGVWQEKAGALVGWAHGKLLADPDRLAWLSSSRGLSIESVKRFRLGWNPSDLYRDRSGWGLPSETWENGEPKKLKIHSGLVIPTYRGGVLVRVQFRREEGDPRYAMLSGSSKEPTIAGEGEAGAVIVESELDAFLVAQEAGDLVRAVAIRSATSKPDAGTHAILTDGRAVLVALDSDQAGGKAAWGFWQENYPRAIRWPVPGAKDPTDAWRAGLPIRGWVVDGLRSLLPGTTPTPPVRVTNGDIPPDLEEIRATLTAAARIADRVPASRPDLETPVTRLAVTEGRVPTAGELADLRRAVAKWAGVQP